MAIRTFHFNDTDDKWSAGSVYDEIQQQSQEALNQAQTTRNQAQDALNQEQSTRNQAQDALNVTTAQLAALMIAANEGKFIKYVNGTFVAAEVDEAAAEQAQAMIAAEEASSTASRAHAVGDYFRLNGILYITTAAIAIGETITPGTNCAVVVLGDDVSALKSAIKEVINNKKSTTGTANTWIIVPYSVSVGKEYVIYNYSDTATISFRTMATPDGANIDVPPPIGPNNSVGFTASANASYLRVISTGVNTDWGIEEKGTEIDVLQEDINSVDRKIQYIISEICVTGNTYYHFPFDIKNGKTYKCTSLTSGNTMAMRTKASQGSANIDVIDGIVTGSPKYFTATADAKILTVVSYLNNGAFTVEEMGTISSTLEELIPTVPIVNLPPKLYAVTGKELNVYFDNIVENSTNYAYNITCSKGKQMERGYSFIPSDDDAGTYTFRLDVISNNTVIATSTAILVVSAASSGGDETVKILILGDSTTNGTDTKIVANFADDAMSVESLGTQGTSPALHEGRVGWTIGAYYNSATYGGIANPFYNPASHLFDADYYFTNSNIDKPDWFFIQLGINDVFLLSDDSTLISALNTMITQCNYIVESIKTASENTKIGVAVTIPPNQSQDAFGKAYGCGQTRDRYKRNNMLWVKRLITEYSGKENEKIYLVPISTNLDTLYNMGFETKPVPVNARNSDITYKQPIANGGVHPVETGYYQLADVYMAFIKGNAS